MSLVIGLAGDCMLGRGVNAFLDHASYETIWGDFLEDLRNTDLNLINCENAFTKSEKMVSKVFNFKADPKKVEALVKARIDVVNLANNHVLDFSEEGLLETIETLDHAKILHVGAGKDLIGAKKPVILEKKGIKIGILGYTDNEPEWNAGENKPGVRYLRVGDTSILEDVRALKKEVDVVIVTIHWGPNMREKPPKSFRSFAHLLIDNGVDILHGHSAHIFQGVEKYKKGLILYDTGDFIDDYYVDPILRNDQSLLFLVEVTKKGVKSLKMIPSVIKHYAVFKAKGAEKEEIQRRMDVLSSELMTSTADPVSLP